MTVTANGDTVNYDKAGSQRTADMVRTAPCGLIATATFTPAASSHTAGDSVGGAVALDFSAITGSTIRIVSATLQINGATIETTAWRLHLYSVTPPSATADDGAWDIPSGDRASYLGYVDFVQIVDMGSTLYIETTNIQKQLKLTGSGVFGYLVNGTTLTTQAVAHIVTLQAVYV